MRKITILVLVFILSSQFLGCYGLRKKFVRKRKAEVPPPLYLELKEYPKVPTKEMYEEYYLFVKGWLDELVKTIEEGISSKRQKKSIDEAIQNLEQIIYYYNEEGRKKIEPLHKELLLIRNKIYDPYFISSSNHSSLVRKISKIKRIFERDFTYDKAVLWIKSQ